MKVYETNLKQKKALNLREESRRNKGIVEAVALKLFMDYTFYK